MGTLKINSRLVEAGRLPGLPTGGFQSPLKKRKKAAFFKQIISGVSYNLIYLFSQQSYWWGL